MITILYYLYNVENNVLLIINQTLKEYKKDSNDVIIRRQSKWSIYRKQLKLKKLNKNILNSNKMKYNDE